MQGPRVGEVFEAPSGIYNVAAGNVRIGRAFGAEGPCGKVIFIGHELNASSRMPLESGQGDVA